MAKDMDIQALLRAADNRRPGVRPLPVHVGAVLAGYAKDPAKYARLAGDMEAMVAGIKIYQDHPFRRKMKPLAEVWREGQASLLFHPAAGKKKRGAVLLVPSMINRSIILDILPERSFTRWLAAQGFDVCLLDWGDPVKDADMADMEGVIRKRLVPALAFAHAEYGPLDVMGYCMGGTLLAAGALLAPQTMRSAVFLASPWDFHAGDRALATQIQAGTPAALQMIDQNGTLPANWIQSVFAIVNADRAVRKFAEFAALDQDSEKAKMFVAVEDWLNDGVDFPGALARECIAGWYGGNAPGKGEWKLGRRKVDPTKIKTRSLVVASSTDRLVPMESSLALADLIPNCEVIKPAIGHIGMMTGRQAEKTVWDPVLRWLESAQ